MASLSNTENLDELLVSLLSEFKPHLQTHSHRMKSWSLLLKEFNRRSGLNYRQTRTLKRRFDKLCSVYLKYGSVKVSNFDTFKQLVFQFEHERQKSGSSMSTAVNNNDLTNKMAANTYNDEIEEEDHSGLTPTSKGSNPESTEVMLEDSENETPLDSITLLPHSHMKRIRKQQMQEIGYNDNARDNISTSSSIIAGNGSPMMGRDPSEQAIRQQLIDLQNCISIHEQEEKEFRNQMMQKLSYIASLLDNNK